MSTCRDISFYGFIKENTNFTFLDSGMMMRLDDGSTVSFINIDDRFDEYKSIRFSFIEVDSTEYSFIIGTKILLKFCLTRFFQYKENLKTLQKFSKTDEDTLFTSGLRNKFA